MLALLDRFAFSISSRINSQRLTRLVFALLIGFFTVVVALMFFLTSRLNGYSRVYVLDMIAGRAWKPFVYRTLLPTTVRILTSAVPEGGREWLNGLVAQTPILTKFFQTLGWEVDRATEYFFLSGLIFLSLCGFVFSIRYLFTGLFHASPNTANLATLLAVAGLPPFFNYTYLYDFTALFLFTFGLALMVHARWRAYLLVFLIACFNKETIVLLTFLFGVFFFFRRDVSRPQFYRLLAAQVLIFASVKGLLTLTFANNPGSMVEFHLLDHNVDLFISWLKPYGWTSLLTGLGLLFLLLSHWKDQPLFLRQGLWILLPLILLNLFLGFFEELRDYYEAYPILALLIIHNIGKILGLHLEPRTDFGLAALSQVPDTNVKGKA